MNPIIDALGTRAAFESCFVTSDVEVGPEGDMFELAFNLGKPITVNAILIAQDQFNGWSDEHAN